jgi:hypothetical protein
MASTEPVEEPTDTQQGHYRSPDPAVCWLSVRMRPFVYDAFYAVTRQRGMTMSQGVRKLIRDVVQGRVTL